MEGASENVPSSRRAKNCTSRTPTTSTPQSTRTRRSMTVTPTTPTTPGMARPRRGPDKARQAARVELVKVPKSMDDCAFNLRIVAGSQLHKDLVLAIVQYTGYTKTFPNANGQIPARSSVNDVGFTMQFQAIVDTFLALVGAKFFPPLIPKDAGCEYYTSLKCAGQISWKLWDNQNISFLTWLQGNRMRITSSISLLMACRDWSGPRKTSRRRMISEQICCSCSRPSGIMG